MPRKINKALKPEEVELEFLRYFYVEVGNYLGPADDDIYSDIAEAFEEEHGVDLPAGYGG